MIGRVEITEILGMLGTCAALLVAGVAVEAMDGVVEPAWAVSGDAIEAPELPSALTLPNEVTLETPVLRPPEHPSLPDPEPVVLALPEACRAPCGCVLD